MKITKIQNSHENSSCTCPGDVPSFPWHCCGYLPSTVEDPNALDPRTITTSSLRCAAVTAQMSFLEFSQATSQTPKYKIITFFFQQISFALDLEPTKKEIYILDPFLWHTHTHTHTHRHTHTHTHTHTHPKTSVRCARFYQV